MQCHLSDCDVEFEPKSDNQLYCTPNHAKRAQDRRYYARFGHKVKYIRECVLEECDKIFETNQPNRLYCSVSHVRRAKKLRLRQIKTAP